MQGTGEGRPFSDTELQKLLALGKAGCLRLCEEQSRVMGESCNAICACLPQPEKIKENGGNFG